jgi:hypothetical protein
MIRLLQIPNGQPNACVGYVEKDKVSYPGQSNASQSTIPNLVIQ